MDRPLSLDQVYEKLSELSQTACVVPSVYRQMHEAIKHAVDTHQHEAAEYKLAYQSQVGRLAHQDRMIARRDRTIDMLRAGATNETIRDAARWQEVCAAFDGMKTSTSERFLDCLGVDGDVCAPLGELLDGRAARRNKLKCYQVEFVLYASVRPDGETWESMNVLAPDMVAAEATFFRQVGGEASVYKHFTKELP